MDMAVVVDTVFGLTSGSGSGSTHGSSASPAPSGAAAPGRAVSTPQLKKNLGLLESRTSNMSFCYDSKSPSPVSASSASSCEICV
jgi:hypothetical protein